MDKDQIQKMQMLKLLGIDLNPMSQASGLVNLINASEAPGIQQSQFDRKMGQDEQQFGANQDFRNMAFQADQGYKDRALDVQGQETEMRNRYYEMGPMFDLLQPGMALSGQGMLPNPHPFMRLAELLGLPSGLFGAGPSEVDRSGDIKDIPDDAVKKAREARGF